MPLTTQEKEVLQKVLKEMKDSHTLIAFWLKDSAIEATLHSWIVSLETLIEPEEKNE
jgi:hypothetical protein